MLEHQRASRTNGAATARDPSAVMPLGRRTVNLAAPAARAQAGGRAHLNALAKSLSRGSLGGSSTRLAESSALSSTPEPSPMETEQQDHAVVMEEYQCWVSGGLITNEDELDNFDLVRYWQVRNSSTHNTCWC